MVMNQKITRRINITLFLKMLKLWREALTDIMLHYSGCFSAQPFGSLSCRKLATPWTRSSTSRFPPHWRLSKLRWISFAQSLSGYHFVHEEYLEGKVFNTLNIHLFMQRIVRSSVKLWYRQPILWIQPLHYTWVLSCAQPSTYLYF